MDTIRLIASDLDATLLDGQSQLPPDFAETVRALAERGIRFAAASGRPIYTLEEMFAPLRDDIIFVGDRMTPGGNDYPAAQAGAIALQVTGPQDTVRLCDILLPLLGGEPVRQDG